MISSCILNLVNFMALPWTGHFKTFVEKNSARSVNGDEVDDVPQEPGRASQRKTHTGTLIAGILSFFRKLVDKVCNFFGFESPIDKLHRKFIIAPNSHIECKPCELKIPHEEVVIRNGDVTLRGCLLKSPIETQKTVIFLNGRGHNSSKCFEKFVELQKKVPVNILMVDYRGFGRSSGTPTFNGLVSDAEAMYNFLRKEKGLKVDDISIFGASLGGGVAIQLAKRKEVNALVIQSSFTSIEDVAGDIMSSVLPDVLIDAVTPLVVTKFNSQETIKEVKAKQLLIIHGTNDKVIPYKHGVSLFREAKKANLKPIFIKLKGAEHTNCTDFYDDDCIKLFRRLFGVSGNTINKVENNRVLAKAA